MLKVFAALLMASLVAFTVLTYKRWEGEPPQVAFDRDFKALGRNPAFNVTVQDAGTGLKHVSIRLKQNNQDIVLADEDLDRTPSKVYDVGKLINEKYKVQEGPASVNISASDHAMRNLFRGNQTVATKDFVFHITPPRLEVLEGQHYINQGGSECVVYRVSESVETSGVRVGERFFPGYPINGADKNLRFALFALEYDWPMDAPLKVVARDSAGNEVTAEFWHKVFPKKFRSRTSHWKTASFRRWFRRSPDTRRKSKIRAIR
jgi:hypothetical protein